MTQQTSDDNLVSTAYSDLVHPIPLDAEGMPDEWSKADLAKLAELSPHEFQRHLVNLLRWYIKEDEVCLSQPGNEYWAAGHYMAKALVSVADEQRASRLQGLLSIVDKTAPKKS